MTIQRVTPDDTDRAYFTITPNLVWALCRNPFDFMCWCTVKLIAGDKGACILTSGEAAQMAGMSEGKWIECRTHLLEVGAIVGQLVRDPSYQHPVWHLRIPDLWPANIRWREATGDSLRARIAAVVEARKVPHHMRHLLEKPPSASPHEASASPHEALGQSASPHEASASRGDTKEEPLRITRDEEPVRITPAGVGLTPQGWTDLIDWLRNDLNCRSVVQSYLLPARVALDGDVLTVWTHNCTAADVLRKSNFKHRFVREVERAFGRPLTVKVISPSG